MSIVSFVLPGAAVDKKRRAQASANFPQVVSSDDVDASLLAQNDQNDTEHAGFEQKSHHPSGDQQALQALLALKSEDFGLFPPMGQQPSRNPALPRLFEKDAGPCGDARSDNLDKLFAPIPSRQLRISRKV